MVRRSNLTITFRQQNIIKYKKITTNQNLYDF